MADGYVFEIRQATEILQSFHKISGIGCTLFAPDAETGGVSIFHSEGACKTMCPYCSDVEGELWNEHCQQVHANAALFSDRFGRYYYQCDQDRIFIASPIVADGGLAACLTIGPVHIFDVEEARAKGSDANPFPIREPEYVQHLSNLLEACASAISDSSQSHLQYIKKIGTIQQSRIHTAIMKNKRSEGYAEYPIEAERRLVSAIIDADASTARAVLNDLLGILLSSEFVGDKFSLKERAFEILTMCSRAALAAGGNSKLVLQSAQEYREEMEKFKTNEQFCIALQQYVEWTVGYMQRLKGVNYEDDILRATDFIRSHYYEHLTLNRVADAVGFSPSYFSRLFKKKYGCNFNEYVNEVRIEVSKNYLLTTSKPIADIAHDSGFDDPSYFARVFKRLCGVTPGYYRSHRGQLVRDRSNASNKRTNKSIIK